MSKLKTIFVVSFLVSCGAATTTAAEPATAPRERQFRLTYGVAVTGLEAGAAVRLWMPVPPDNDEQRVQVVEQSLPGASQQAREPKYGNDVLYVSGAADRAGQVAARTVYGVTRQEARGTPAAMMMEDPLTAL